MTRTAHTPRRFSLTAQVPAVGSNTLTSPLSVVPEKRINLSLPDMRKKRNIRDALLGEPKKAEDWRNCLLAKRLN
jgi:hypothetical protein